MSATERREEIRKVMEVRRKETVPRLAAEFHVCENTIRHDILVLTEEIPLETKSGNGGGVELPDWYHPHKNILSNEQNRVLQELMAGANEHQREVIAGMLREYGNGKIPA